MTASRLGCASHGIDMYTQSRWQAVILAMDATPFPGLQRIIAPHAARVRFFAEVVSHVLPIHLRSLCVAQDTGFASQVPNKHLALHPLGHMLAPRWERSLLRGQAKHTLATAHMPQYAASAFAITVLQLLRPQSVRMPCNK
jgi:hypothetical protein